MSVGDLQSIALRKLSAELRKGRPSVLAGETLPGLLVNELVIEDLIRQIWDNTVIDFEYMTVPNVRIFFGSDVIREISLTQVTDQEARELNSLHFPVLESLSIVDSSKLTDVGLLNGPSSLKNLVSLEFVNCPRITWNGVSCLVATDVLTLRSSLTGSVNTSSETILPLNRTSLTIDGGNPALISLVKSLVISLNDVKPNRLTTLKIKNNPAANDSLAHACVNAPNLTTISFSFGTVTHDCISSLAFLPNLESLDLSFCKIQPEVSSLNAYDAWLSFKKLNFLNLCGVESSNFLALSSISEIPTLKQICVRSCALESWKMNNADVGKLFAVAEEVDLSINRKLDDATFMPISGYDGRLLDYKVTKLHLSGTGVRFPALLNTQWSHLNEISFDSTNISPEFVVQFLVSQSREDNEIGAFATPEKVSLRFCKTVDDRVLRAITQSGGLRKSLKYLDLTGSCCSHRAISALSSANNTTKISPESNRGYTPETDTVNIREEESDIEDDILSTHSSLSDRAMRRFVKNIQYIEGDLPVNSLDSYSDEDSFESDTEEEDEDQIAYHRELLSTSCCDCQTCATTHLGEIIMPKLRYSKEELLKLR